MQQMRHTAIDQRLQRIKMSCISFAEHYDKNNISEFRTLEHFTRTNRKQTRFVLKAFSNLELILKSEISISTVC